MSLETLWSEAWGRLGSMDVPVHLYHPASVLQKRAAIAETAVSRIPTTHTAPVQLFTSSWAGWRVTELHERFKKQA